MKSKRKINKHKYKKSRTVYNARSTPSIVDGTSSVVYGTVYDSRSTNDPHYVCYDHIVYYPDLSKSEYEYIMSFLSNSSYNYNCNYPKTYKK